MPTLCPHRSASVDDQVEPLSALVRAAGGTPREVLLAYPGLAVVPVAHLKGTRHVLRQLGVAGAGAGRLGWCLRATQSPSCWPLHPPLDAIFPAWCR